MTRYSWLISCISASLNFLLGLGIKLEVRAEKDHPGIHVGRDILIFCINQILRRTNINVFEIRSLGPGMKPAGAEGLERHFRSEVKLRHRLVYDLTNPQDSII